MSFRYIEPVFVNIRHFKNICQVVNADNLVNWQVGKGEREKFIHSFIQQTLAGLLLCLSLG